MCVREPVKRSWLGFATRVGGWLKVQSSFRTRAYQQHSQAFFGFAARTRLRTGANGSRAHGHTAGSPHSKAQYRAFEESRRSEGDLANPHRAAATAERFNGKLKKSERAKREARRQAECGLNRSLRSPVSPAVRYAGKVCRTPREAFLLLPPLSIASNCLQGNSTSAANCAKSMRPHRYMMRK